MVIVIYIEVYEGIDCIGRCGILLNRNDIQGNVILMSVRMCVIR